MYLRPRPFRIFHIRAAHRMQFYYLCFEEAHKRVKQMCDIQNEAFDISSKSLAKKLAEDGLIEVGGDGKNTRTYRFGNVSKRVMFLKKAAMEETMDTEE